MKILKFIMILGVSFITIGLFIFIINTIISVFGYNVLKYSIFLLLATSIIFFITCYKNMFYIKYLSFLILILSIDIFFGSKFYLNLNYDTYYKKYMLLLTIISFVGTYTLFCLSYIKKNRR